MKKIGSYEKAQVYTDIEKLPPDGYIIKILDVNELEYAWGGVLEILFDISEGDYKGYYTQQYKSSQFENKKYKGSYRFNIPKDDGSDQDEWILRRFKTNITAFEESNAGFHWEWDEKKLVGLTVGAVFFEKEYEYNGKRGMFTTVHSLRPVEKIKAGKFKIPDPKMLKPTADVFVEVDDTGDLPWD